MLNLGAASDFVYHWLLNNVNEGAIAASKIPRKILAVSRPWYLEVAAVQAVTRPHRRTFRPSHLATGTFCKMYAAEIS